MNFWLCTDLRIFFAVEKHYIAAIQDDKDFSIASPRIANAKSLAEELLKKAVESEENMDKFDTFAIKLLEVIRNACKEDKRLKQHSTKRKKIWSAFHKTRMDVLPALWAKLMNNIGLKNNDTGEIDSYLCTLSPCS